MISLTNKNTVLLRRTIHLFGSGTAPWDISVHTRANDSQASRFLTLQLILDKLCMDSINDNHIAKSSLFRYKDESSKVAVIISNELKNASNSKIESTIKYFIFCFFNLFKI